MELNCFKMAPIWSLPSELELFADWFVATMCTGIESPCISDFHSNAETTFFQNISLFVFCIFFSVKTEFISERGLKYLWKSFFQSFHSPFLRKGPKCSN